MVKNLLAMQESQVQSLGWKDILEKERTTHSSILTWEILRTEEAPSSPPVWVPPGRGRAGRGGGAGPLLGSQAPAPGTIEAPSRTPLPGRPGLSAGGEEEGPGRVPLCPLSRGRSVPDRRRPPAARLSSPQSV